MEKDKTGSLIYDGGTEENPPIPDDEIIYDGGTEEPKDSSTPKDEIVYDGGEEV